jgi:hypothetical protein
MAQKEDYQKTLSEIRDLMIGSARVNSISGLAVICAGITAAVGFVAFYAHFKIRLFDSLELDNEQILSFLLYDGLIVLAIALISGYLLAVRITRKRAEKLWTPPFKRVVLYGLIPLLSGGFVLSACFLGINSLPVSAAISLSCIFYGLSLLGVSRYTLNEFFWQGLISIVFGLFGFYIGYYTLIFWILTFGVTNIAFGIYIFNKYENIKKK